MQTVLYVVISVIVCFLYFQAIDYLLMDMQGLDYFYMFRG